MIKLTLSLLLFFTLTILVSGQAPSKCEDLKACISCTAQPACGWCAPTQSCLNGTEVGPYNSTCLGSAWEFDSCTPCNTFTDCHDCLSRDTDCFWCSSVNGGSGGCRDQGFTCTHASHCPCALSATCSSCLQDTLCRWCTESDNCIELNETCVGPQPVLNSTQTCPCSVQRTCSDCQLANACNWCMTGECTNEDCTVGNPITNCQWWCNNASQSCDTCVTVEGCAWCPLSRQCVDAATSACPFTFSCPMCNVATYCDTCLSISGCSWCDDSVSCELDTKNCLKALSCSQFCGTFTDCDSCSNTKGCGWCDDTSVCADVSQTFCFYTHSCSKKELTVPHCGFNGGSFVGGMFLVIGILLLLIAIYFFYRWRTGRKFDYRELR